MKTDSTKEKEIICQTEFARLKTKSISPAKLLRRGSNTPVLAVHTVKSIFVISTHVPFHILSLLCKHPASPSTTKTFHRARAMCP